MTSTEFLLAQQSLNWFDEIQSGLWELWLLFNRSLREGTIVWVLLIVVGVLVYQRFFRK